MEREVNTHFDGHGLNESIRIIAGEPGPGGASHNYAFEIGGTVVGFLQFQLGPRDVQGSTPGLTTAAVMAALVDHLEGFQAGEFKNRETALAITHLQEAMHWIKDRADARARRGVLGTYAR